MKSILVDVKRCVACRTCEVSCALNRSSLSKRLPEAFYEPVPPLPRVRVETFGDEGGFPIQCRHCDDAPCLDACPSGALYRTPEGLVLTHDERCIGCWMCIMVCPFGAPQPFRHFRKVIKCDLCEGMDGPYCVENCPTHALVLADTEEMAKGKAKFRNEGNLSRLNFVSAKGLSKAE
jgi:carbon-monoxide dehydrogenase iron sulfur subunit